MIAVPTADEALAHVAASMAEPVRARMLCCLMDGHARTATELAAVGEVAASTASAHLAKLLAQGLVGCMAQGKHRYYRLAGAEVGQALEAMLVLAGQPRPRFEPSTPPALRQARRCYDHLAGHWGVRLHDLALGRAWIGLDATEPRGYHVTDEGLDALRGLGVDVDAATGARRRKLACACMDWSERRPHLGGALGAAWLQAMLAQGWLDPDPDSRALRVTRRGLTRLERLLEDTTT
ncbi:ArsR/SmtB family transcription factor [Roseateles chitosanitabidus]|jgi:DNA-binding transcriptional ArsR family regulator|uniref:ArsR/SmtB family transcription factor n=1 Tax=Roseateles chitosanitabidus TaxID=65048 RepID=UPI00082BC26A|nr:helix-turn-helix transcriptional regulator [Roseateles chitosanitabidus]MBO9685776.1 helix-turn-helix transcriptional regulator [Roseateles chitosanitabidus]